MTTPIQMVLPPPPDPSILQLCDQLNDTVWRLAQQMAQNNHIQAASRRMDDTEAATGQKQDIADRSTAVECIVICRRLLSEVLPAQYHTVFLTFEQAIEFYPLGLTPPPTV